MKLSLIVKTIAALSICTTIFTAQAASPDALKRVFNKHIALENPDRFDNLVIHLLKLFQAHKITLDQFIEGKSFILEAIHTNRPNSADFYLELDDILKKHPKVILHQNTQADAISKIDSSSASPATGSQPTS